MLSARFISKDTQLALLSFDGLGDFVSTAMGRADGNNISVFQRVWFPHSLGFFYTAMTQYLGFPYFGDEYKVMGLSSYGKPKYLESLREVLRDEFASRLREAMRRGRPEPPVMRPWCLGTLAAGGSTLRTSADRSGTLSYRRYSGASAM